jgi:two-component system cell cycle sensor histidine kinase/response regulator CckA
MEPGIREKISTGQPSSSSDTEGVVVPDPLRVLIIEDRLADLELILHELKRAGLGFTHAHVDNEADYTAHLDSNLDVILADFSLPQFNALRALEIMQEKGVHVPFIVVTGSISEEVAVECMKKGATDYLLKDRLARLGPAIEQALEARRLHEEKVRADEQIRLRNKELTLLNRIIAASAESTDERTFLDVACRELAQALDTHHTIAILFNDDRSSVSVIAEHRAPQAQSVLNQVFPATGRSMPDMLTSLKAPLVMSDIESDSSMAHLHGLFAGERIASLALIPLSVEGETVGGLGLAVTEGHHFTPDKVELVTSVAGQLSSALARTRLERDRRRLSTTIEQWTDSVIITDNQAAILYVNPGFEHMTGYRRADVIGRDVRIVGSDTIGDDFHNTVLAVLSEGQLWRGRFANRRKDGTLYTADTSITPVRDANGIVVNSVALMRDITAELQMEQRFLHSQKMEAIGRLAGGVAHDFNNLLTAIMGYADLLSTEIDAGTPARANLEEIKRTAERAAGVSRQLLVFSRKQVLSPRVLDLNDTVADIEKMLRHLIGEDIILKTSLDPHGGCVRADPGQIQQVIMNLAVNARDAMPHGGELVLSTQNVELGESYARQHPGALPGSYVKLTVTDTGVGMSEEVLSHLFEPFYTTKEEGKGTGLGLATVYGIIKQSGGHIWAQSEPEKGTTFSVFLPRVEREAAAAQTMSNGQAMPGGKGTILLVEDNEMVRELGIQILSRLGYIVLAFRGAEQAVAGVAAQNAPVDMLISDIVMPVMGGRDLAAQIRKLYPNLKVLFMSGYEESGPSAGPASIGTSFLQKPFTPQMLAQKVRELLDG